MLTAVLIPLSLRGMALYTLIYQSHSEIQGYRFCFMWSVRDPGSFHFVARLCDLTISTDGKREEGCVTSTYIPSIDLCHALPKFRKGWKHFLGI
jgi:hypothetical protein